MHIYTYLDCLHELNYAFYYSKFNWKWKFKFIPNFYNKQKKNKNGLSKKEFYPTLAKLNGEKYTKKLSTAAITRLVFDPFIVLNSQSAERTGPFFKNMH